MSKHISERAATPSGLTTPTVWYTAFEQILNDFQTAILVFTGRILKYSYNGFSKRFQKVIKSLYKSFKYNFYKYETVLTNKFQLVSAHKMQSQQWILWIKCITLKLNMTITRSTPPLHLNKIFFHRFFNALINYSGYHRTVGVTQVRRGNAYNICHKSGSRNQEHRVNTEPRRLPK